MLSECITQLSKALAENEKITEIEITIRVSKNSQEPKTASIPSADSTLVSKDAETAIVKKNTHTIVAPMVGTFYLRPSPDKDPYVKVGEEVSEDTVVCIVEAMKLMNEIQADKRGRILEVLAKDAQPVDYNAPLFLIELMD